MRSGSAAWVAASTCIGLLAGCGGNTPTRDYDLVYTDVEPLEYARILCSGIDMRDRHTCLTSALQHQKEMREYFNAHDPNADEVIDGPFVVVLRDEIYRGTYVSQPFAAAFTVSNGVNICRGRYNAFAGDTKAIFHVRCDDGATGTANIILDQRGRNGLGEVTMDDGTQGKIVFGYTAVGGAYL